MRPTKLLLVEGIPGAGKSTLAHALLRQLHARGTAAHWWYEEVAGHPVYCFRDRAGLLHVVADLASGQHRRAIAAALVQWRRFAAEVAASDEIVLLDGCLFGYLTWSLFPFAVPADEILAYVAEVGAILADLRPHVVYLQQADVPASWRWLSERRGDRWTEGAIERATASAYGRLNDLTGFPGLIAFWQAYQRLADDAFVRLPFPKVRLQTAPSARSQALPDALSLLGLSPFHEPCRPPADLVDYTGTYARHDAPSEPPAVVTLHDGDLRLDGVPQFWPQNRLILLPAGDFAVESFPHTIRFAHGRMSLVGPALLSGGIPELWLKLETDSSLRSE